MVTELSQCVHCGKLVFRGRADGAWHRRPDPGELLMPEEAARCLKRDDGLPHEVPQMRRADA